jgi:hypothetical protein
MTKHVILPEIAVEKLGQMDSDMPVSQQDHSEFLSGQCAVLL